MEFVIGVCDDLETERVILAGMIQDYCKRQGLHSRILLYASGDELLAEFRPGLFHILFLDIYMPGTSGMEAARRIRQSDTVCAIIFATASQDHGLDSYDVQASDYLVKPFTAADVEDALSWCVASAMTLSRSLKVQAEGSTRLVPIRELRYIEIQGHTAYLHTREEVIATRRGMDELEQEISNDDFLRCHRSFLVNMNDIHCIEKNTFRLSNGEEIPIGSTVAARVKDRYMSWSFVKSWEKRQ